MATGEGHIAWYTYRDRNCRFFMISCEVVRFHNADTRRRSCCEGSASDSCCRELSLVECFCISSAKQHYTNIESVDLDWIEAVRFMPPQPHVQLGNGPHNSF